MAVTGEDVAGDVADEVFVVRYQPQDCEQELALDLFGWPGSRELRAAFAEAPGRRRQKVSGTSMKYAAEFLAVVADTWWRGKRVQRWRRGRRSRITASPSKIGHIVAGALVLTQFENPQLRRSC